LVASDKLSLQQGRQPTRMFRGPLGQVEYLLRLLGYPNCASCVCLPFLGALNGRVGKNSAFDCPETKAEGRRCMGSGWRAYASNRPFFRLRFPPIP